MKHPNTAADKFSMQFVCNLYFSPDLLLVVISVVKRIWLNLPWPDIYDLVIKMSMTRWNTSHGNYPSQHCNPVIFKSSFHGISTYQQWNVQIYNISNNTCWALLENSKDKIISKILLWTSTHVRTSVGQPTKTYIHELCANTGCHLEDLLSTKVDWDRWQERI